MSPLSCVVKFVGTTNCSYFCVIFFMEITYTEINVLPNTALNFRHSPNLNELSR